MNIKRIILFSAISFLIIQVPREATGMKSHRLQSTSIKGRVFRSDIKQPIPDADVVLLDDEKLNRSEKNMETKTDANGEYTLQGVKPGKYGIVVSVSYKDEKDLPCGKEVDRFINNGVGVTSWRDKELFLQHATTPAFSVSAGRALIKNFDFSCKRRMTKRK
jgi:hypothetical protein